MLLIIFGTKDRRKVEQSGQFMCPKCGVERDYEVISIKEWFTLFSFLFFQQKIMRKGRSFWNAKPAKNVRG